jgi:hypothetical protein
MMSDVTWPLFKFSRQQSKKFWDYDTEKNCNTAAIFEGSLIRIGKKNVEPKAYFFRVTNNGILKYYKNVIWPHHLDLGKRQKTKGADHFKLLCACAFD